MTNDNRNLEGSTDVSRVDSASVNNKTDLDVEKSRLSTPSDSKDATVDLDPTTAEHPHSEKQHDAEKVDNATEDEEQYPAKWRLALISTALCLSVFCMALVS